MGLGQSSKSNIKRKVVDLRVMTLYYRDTHPHGSILPTASPKPASAASSFLMIEHHLRGDDQVPWASLGTVTPISADAPRSVPLQSPWRGHLHPPRGSAASSGDERLQKSS